MEGIKIFLDNKKIVLTNKPPDTFSREILAVAYKDLQVLSEEYRKFEKHPVLHTMIISTEEDINHLLHDFISLFDYVEAAGGRVLNEKDELLVIFRYGKWDLPKGKIHTGKDKETPVEAAVREVMEETGINKVEPVKPLPSTYHIFRHENKRILKRTWWFEMLSDSNQLLIPQTEEDISVVKWVNKTEIEEIRHNTYASLKELF